MSSNQKTAAESPAYRSGAVARLTGIPVETLRVWERRYKIVGPRQSATGQRLYSPDEVARLTVIKQLVDLGYAIGSIAALGLQSLRAMLDKAPHAIRGAPRHAGPGAAEAMVPVRVAIVGETLAMRVERQRLPTLLVVGASANAALASGALRGVTADALLIELPTLQRETPQALFSLAQQLGARRIVVEYGFGPQRLEQELRAMGCRLVHAPLDVDQLESLCRIPPAARLPQIDPAAPRRFDNKALAEIAMASVALSCECPHHLADLLVRLGNFETYSAECESRSPADAELHRYLKHVAGSARATLEAALARVIEAEGISLPV